MSFNDALILVSFFALKVMTILNTLFIAARAKTRGTQSIIIQSIIEHVLCHRERIVQEYTFRSHIDILRRHHPCDVVQGKNNDPDRPDQMNDNRDAANCND
jgi:hypothetical protein